MSNGKKSYKSYKSWFKKCNRNWYIYLKSDLSKLSDVVKNDAIKISLYNNLVTKVNNIGTSGFALKTKYDAERKQYLGFTEKKIQIQKRKFLVLMGSLKIQIIMLKLLKKKTKCQLLVV